MQIKHRASVNFGRNFRLERVTVNPWMKRIWRFHLWFSVVETRSAKDTTLQHGRCFMTDERNPSSLMLLTNDTITKHTTAAHAIICRLLSECHHGALSILTSYTTIKSYFGNGEILHHNPPRTPAPPTQLQTKWQRAAWILPAWGITISSNYRRLVSRLTAVSRTQRKRHCLICMWKPQ